MYFFRRCCFAFVFLSLSVFPAGAAPLLLVDATTYEVLYAEDAGQPWHPASLTKLMTAYLAFAAIQQGRITLDTPITISQNAWNQAPAKSGLEVGASITLRDALYIMVVKSANDIAIAVGEAVSGSEKNFVAEMNDMSAKMGLTATHYENPNGLHNEKQVTSARDLAVLALYVRRDYPQYQPMFETEAVRLGSHFLESNNGLLEHFQGANGMKTGYVCASGLNIVATAERHGRTLLAVMLGGSSARERNEMTAQMLLRGFSGELTGKGQAIVTLDNKAGPPIDMRPLICGKKAKAYVKQRMADFPMGLKGQPSYLTDKIAPRIYVATDLSSIRTDIPLPRPRPNTSPLASN